MAIVGYGQIGREIALRARPFGIRTIAVSRTRKSDDLLDESYTLSELDQALARADIVMLTIALTPETRHLFDRRRLAACKPGVVLINVARGGLVDQQALAAALASGQVGGAGLDVVDPEPLPASDPLWAAPNLIISPHFAGGGSVGQPAAAGRERRRQSQAAHQGRAAAASRELRLDGIKGGNMHTSSKRPVRHGGRTCIAAGRDRQRRAGAEAARARDGLRRLSGGRRDRHGRASRGRSRSGQVRGHRGRRRTGRAPAGRSRPRTSRDSRPTEPRCCSRRHSR